MLDPAALVAGAYDTRYFRLSPRAKRVFAGGHAIDVHQDTEKRIVLPNGHTIRLSVDGSGTGTQIEENDRLHGLVRPNTIRLKIRSVT